MNSLGTSSKWPSSDSLPSTPSLHHSENEQTEDEADVSSEGEGDHGTSKSFSIHEGLRLSGSYLAFPGHSDKLYLGAKNDQPQQCTGRTKHPDLAPSLGADTVKLSSATPGDLAFAKKCADLHRFICPLLHLLQGLKAGRFDKGLTSFQQSVALDRLQRILGILQKPEMGEKYLHNLLQIEGMLKLWFPHVALEPRVTVIQSITPRMSPHWCQSQRHMPVKKRKLAWSDPDQSGKDPPTEIHQQGGHESYKPVMTLEPVSTRLTGATRKRKTPEDEPEDCWADEHEFTNSAETLSRLSHLCIQKETQPKNAPLFHCGNSAAQNRSVTSSADVTSADSC